ncbi:MAG TPA: undecaprenyl-diphosphate phosphatase, partial [Candidatus Saccharimonadales bacterium]|nr:undecaprenyl-diphosphate phosphatase [Candidatus Saccharimonadales bacterium]
MITVFQAAVLGLLQGAFELFPVSSLGHGVIFPALFGWNIHENDKSFLIFLVATHLATALVLIGFFWSTWVGVVAGIFRSLRLRQIKADDIEAKLGWLLVVGTVPAGILGLLFQDNIRAIFITARSAAFFLILNGFMLLGAEALRRRAKNTTAGTIHTRIAKLSWWQSARIGTVQALALIPGFSRSGSSMAGSLLAGLSNEDAAHFSFLLATPLILAAGVLKLPELFQQQNHDLIL